MIFIIIILCSSPISSILASLSISLVWLLISNVSNQQLWWLHLQSHFNYAQIQPRHVPMHHPTQEQRAAGSSRQWNCWNSETHLDGVQNKRWERGVRSLAPAPLLCDVLGHLCEVSDIVIVIGKKDWWFPHINCHNWPCIDHVIHIRREVYNSVSSNFQTFSSVPFCSFNSNRSTCVESTYATF